MCIAGDGTVQTPTDSKGNAYTAIDTQLNLTFNNSRCYHTLNAVGGASHTFTGTVTGASIISVAMVEVTQGGTVSAGPAARGADAATAFASPDITTSIADSILIGFATQEGGGGTYTITHGNSFSGIDSLPDGSSFFPVHTSYRIVSSTGTYSTSVTLAFIPDNTANWIMSYTESAGGGITPRMMLLGAGP